MKIPKTLGGKPLPKRLRNTLLSVAFCCGLFVAYYATTGTEPLPADTHITYESTGEFRLDVDADGHVRLADAETVYTYQISKFAVRRILRTFRQVDFLGLNILAYGRPQSGCQLTLTENHQKAGIQHDCETQAVELRTPVQVLDQVTRFRSVLKGSTAVLSKYHIKSERKAQLLSKQKQAATLLANHIRSRP